MTHAESPSVRLTAEDRARLAALRADRPTRPRLMGELGLGQRLADHVTAAVGSWRFIVVQSILLVFWIALNVTAYVSAWDPYPFILLNLVLSFQAAYTAPIIMMSQNRQAEIDRRNAASDYHVNVKAELEIELLHAKLDALREEEIARLAQTVERLAAMLAENGAGPA